MINLKRLITDVLTYIGQQQINLQSDSGVRFARDKLMEAIESSKFERPNVSPHEVYHRLCEGYGYSFTDIISTRQKPQCDIKFCVRYRMAQMGYTRQVIAMIEGSNHSSVTHSVNKVSESPWQYEPYLTKIMEKEL